MACHRLLHAHGPAGQRKRGSAGHSNTHFSKCVNLELTIRQSFAKLRQIWGSNFAGEGKDQEVFEEGEEGSFYRRGRGSPLGEWSVKERPLLLFMVLFIVVTPSSWW
jgi:hypothetical protein